MYLNTVGFMFIRVNVTLIKLCVSKLLYEEITLHNK